MALTSTGSAVGEGREGGRDPPVRVQRAGRAGQPERHLHDAVARAQGGVLERSGRVDASPWAHSKPVKGPWKIGYIAFAITNPYNQHVLDGLKAQFAKAKAKGLVTGSLVTNIPATIAASTPEQEIAAIQQMVRQGINAIIMEPIAGAPLVPAIDAAGKAGVPVILTDIPLPQAKYGVVVWSQNQYQADAGDARADRRRATSC